MSDESPIIFTDSCCAKVADLIAEENNPDLMLRVFVNGGGCSGFQYGFTFDEIKNDDDFEIQKNQILFFEYKKRSHRYDEAFFILIFFTKSFIDYFLFTVK